MAGLHAGSHREPNAPLIFRRIAEGSNAHINVEVIETDFGADDYKGEADVYDDDRGTTVQTTVETQDCDTWVYPLPNGSVIIDTECEDDGVAKTTTFRLDWTPKL